jgi:23S rRNA (uracil1939-C5)-methyltransferase
VSERLTIARLGAQGDGIVETPAGPVFVPFTLAGEEVLADVARDRASVVSIEKAAPLRVQPACRHFGVCGGCAVQHLDDAAYRDWKRELVVQALKSRGIEAEVGELVTCARETRRRVVFSASRTEAGLLIGFNRAQSSEIVTVEECAVSMPAIVSRLDALKQLAALIAATSQAFHLAVTVTASGLDIAVTGAGKPSEEVRRAAVRFVIEGGFARLSLDGEIVVEPRQPMVNFDGITVVPPPGAFLQPTQAAETAMATLVGDHLRRANKVADLFAGCGTFAFRLARRANVHAVEADAASLAALDRAARATPGIKPVSLERRDLYRRPLTFKELARFDGLVFDPPRAGAEEQSRQIARGDVPLVAAVSCNPATLARDLRLLLDGGYSLKSVTPIDQFLWSPHVEAVALLEKPKRRR